MSATRSVDQVGAAELVHGARPRPERRWGAPRRRSDRIAWLYLTPAVVLFGFVILAPVGYSVWISFFDWDGFSPAEPVGLSNYSEAVTDPAVWNAAWHSFVLLLFYSIFPIAIGLVFAAVIARQRLRLAPLWRTLLFLPQVLSIVVVGVAWQWLLQESGPVNEVLRSVGLGGITRSWLGDFTFALPAEGAIGTWMMTGLCMVLLLAGAQAIDPNLYDAASVDGAGPVRQFLHVTVPSLRNVIVVCLVLSAAVSLNNFGLIWVTTQGGPGDSTQVISTAIYTRAFVLSDLGLASALAFLVFLLMMALAGMLSRRTEDA